MCCYLYVCVLHVESHVTALGAVKKNPGVQKHLAICQQPKCLYSLMKQREGKKTTKLPSFAVSFQLFRKTADLKIIKKEK